MDYISLNKVIELTYEIDGISDYAFGKDKQLYNLKRGREIKKTLNGRAVGFWIGRKFYSLNKLRLKLRKIEKKRLSILNIIRF